MIADYLRLGVKNLRKRKLRSWLTILGIVIAVAIIFILISLSVGLQNAINQQFQILGSDKFFIMAKGQMGAPGAGGAVQLTTDDVKAIEKVGGVKAVSYFTGGNGKIEFKGQTKYFIIAGVPLDKSAKEVFVESSSLKIDEGRMIDSGDSGKIMIGSDYKNSNVFDKPVKAGDTLNINGKDFKVVGILGSIGNPSDDKNIYMPMDDFKSLFNSGNRVDEILVQIQQGENIKDIADKVDKRLVKFRGLTEKTKDYIILTPEELLRSFGTILNIITGFLVGVAAISLLVGSVGIANTMFTSVLERTREIGTMKAVGARNSDILLIFLIEAGLLGLIGGIIGTGLGAGVSKIVEIIATQQLGTNLLQAAFPIYLIVGCLAFAVLAGAVSGMIPAYRASRLSPVDALRYE